MEIIVIFGSSAKSTILIPRTTTADEIAFKTSVKTISNFDNWIEKQLIISDFEEVINSWYGILIKLLKMLLEILWLMRTGNIVIAFVLATRKIPENITSSISIAGRWWINIRGRFAVSIKFGEKLPPGIKWWLDALIFCSIFTKAGIIKSDIDSRNAETQDNKIVKNINSFCLGLTHL